MSTYDNFPEEVRPPDSPSNRKYKERKHNSWSHSANIIYANGADNNNVLGLDINRNEEKKSNSLKNKLLCIKSGQESCSKDRNRNSYHQDVEEALNSLLWQPYEYQNKLARDLDDPPNKGPSHSDLNLCTEMVNNLKAAHQSLRSKRSRDALLSVASRLNSQTSSLESVVECSDVYENGDMQVAVTDSTAGTTDDGLIRGTVRTSLSSANVVGLPENPRANHFRYQQHNGTVPEHNRSASVPKSMPGIIPNHQRVHSDSRQKMTPSNVSNVNVNFYRAVPVNVVSAVPTIQCLNTLDEGNNVSNVQIMPLGATQDRTFGTASLITGPDSAPAFATTLGTTQVTVHTSATPPTHSVNLIQTPPSRGTTRTFTSTEAQTDEISVCPPPPTDASVRDQRRKERRERRHQRRTANHRHTVDSGTQANTLHNDRLPDLLNSHMPPPYSPLPSSVPPPNVVMPSPMIVPPPVLHSVVPNNVVPSGLVAFPPPPGQVAGPVAVPVPPPSGFRFPFPAGGFRRGRFSEEPPKGCCGLLAWKPGSLRWFIAVIALVAVCCVLVGTALGAMRPAGRDHLTVSLLMIGVGIVLVTVSGVAWRLTSHDSSTCRSMLGLGSTESVDVCTRRFVPRLPPSYGRPHHPYAAMMYPEFQYRPPPPSYQASMQEYRLRLLLLDRGHTPQIQSGVQNAVSPPPTYRSHAGSLLRAPLSSRRDAAQSEYSCPPSYRSQTSTNRIGTLQSAIFHSREQSLSLSESNHEDNVVNVVSILGSTDEDIALDNITLDSLKMEPDGDLNPLRLLLKGSSSDLEGSKDGNLVTIVQTSDQNPVIVTVSGSSQIEGNTLQITEIPTEMEILAHL